MLAHELYTRALTILASVDHVQVALRSIHYPLRDSHPQCVLTRRYLHYVAPDRMSGTFFGCNPGGEPERSDLVQVGMQAYHRQPLVTAGTWVEYEPWLRTPDDLPSVIAGWMWLPQTTEGWGGTMSTTAFHIPVSTTIQIQGRERGVLVLPVETQRQPGIYFPGMPVSSGPAPRRVMYEGKWQKPSRLVDEGRLYVDARTGRPLRYLSAVVATLDTDVRIVLTRTHVQFRYDPIIAVTLPDIPS